MSREVETFVCVFPAFAAWKGQGILTFCQAIATAANSVYS